MKTCISIIFIALLVNWTSADTLTLESKLKTYEKYREECLNSFQIPESELEKYKSNTFEDSVYDNAIGHCFIKCFLEKVGVFKNDTGFQENHIFHETIGGFIPDQSRQFLTKIEECAKNANQETNTCKRAYVGVSCIVNHLKTVFKPFEDHQ
uniref:OBP8 n=1 Tax=Eupeodes corollae TaxID=290404 RepID=A0A8F9WM56_9MUSC|nr:OBP8 [Eupeodes corollae]